LYPLEPRPEDKSPTGKVKRFLLKLAQELGLGSVEARVAVGFAAFLEPLAHGFSERIEAAQDVVSHFSRLSRLGSL
jgi:hypothetical protein